VLSGDRVVRGFRNAQIRRALWREPRDPAGRLKDPAKIGAAVERALQRSHGYRHYDWELKDGQLTFLEHPTNLAREKKYEGKYLIQTDQSDITPMEAVEQYKQLNEVERGFRSLKHPVSMRPIHHRTEDRVRAHIFVAALAFLLERLLEHHLKASATRLSPADALSALATIRHVTFRVQDEQRVGITPGSSRARQVFKRGQLAFMSVGTISLPQSSSAQTSTLKPSSSPTCVPQRHKQTRQPATRI